MCESNSQLSTLPDNESDEDLAIVNRQQVQRTRGKNKKYYFEATYETGILAEAAIDTEIYTKHKYQKSEDGMKRTYRCKFAKYRGEQCASKCYILYHSESIKASIYQTNIKQIFAY